MPPTVATKKKCCESSPRCKDCPVVWHRLGDEGLAVRVSKRKWRPADAGIPKPAMRAARKR